MSAQLLKGFKQRHLRQIKQLLKLQSFEQSASHCYVPHRLLILKIDHQRQMSQRKPKLEFLHVF